MGFELWTKARSLAGSARGRAVAVAILAVAVAAPLLLLGGGTEAQRERRSPPQAAATNGPDVSPTVAPSATTPAIVNGRWNGYGAWRAYRGPDGTLGNEASSGPSISANGRWVAFVSSSSNLVKGDTNRSADIFVKDRATGKTSRVSVSSSGRQGNDSSIDAAISADGRFIAFVSYASNLVGGDANRCTDMRNSEPEPCPDVFVHDQLTHKTTRVSVASSGAQANRGSDQGVAISDDGRFIGFASKASNLVPGDTNGKTDVFVRDRKNGTTVRVSVTSFGGQANSDSFEPDISGDGTRIVFVSQASNLGTAARTCHAEGGGEYRCPNIFLRDTRTGRTLTITDSAGAARNAAISADGRIVAFLSEGNDLVAGDTNGKQDVFTYEVANDRTTRVSVSSSEAEGNDLSDGYLGLSADGRYISFASSASNLVAGDDQMCENLMDAITYSCRDIFLRDRTAGTTELLSVATSGAQANGDSYASALSADARHAAFDSNPSNLTVTEPGPCAEYYCHNVFVRDRSEKTTRTVSTASPRAKTRDDGDGYSMDPSVSADGSVVAYRATGANFVRDDTNGFADIIVWRRGGGYSRASVSSSGHETNGASESPALASNGAVVAFLSEATNLVAGDTNRQPDIFVRDMAGHRTIRASASSSGGQANGPSSAPALSADGRYVVFTSEATNLVPGDTNDASDIFVHDRATGKTSRVSVSSSEEQGDGPSYHSLISADGNRIAFDSEASNLIPNDTICGEGPSGPISCADIFVRDLAAGTTTVVSVTDEGKVANGPSWTPAISADGRHVVFTSRSNDLADGRDPDDFSEPVYVRDLDRGVTTLVGYPMEQSRVVGVSADGRFVGPLIHDGLLSILDRSVSAYTTVTNCGSTYEGDLAAGGRFLVFGWDCNADGDRNCCADVYMFDRKTRSLEWISKPIR